jgi:hypothetical protein
MYKNNKSPYPEGLKCKRLVQLTADNVQISAEILIETWSENATDFPGARIVDRVERMESHNAATSELLDVVYIHMEYHIDIATGKVITGRSADSSNVDIYEPFDLFNAMTLRPGMEVVYVKLYTPYSRYLISKRGTVLL